MHATLSLCGISIGPRNFSATELSASCGQRWNQSMLQELTNAGNLGSYGPM